MTQTPLVTVVVPAYDAARFVGETLRAACAQTYPRLEIVVVDDGSRDGTAAIVAAIAARDDRVRLVRKANAGVAAARNTGIEAARGELVAILDADDLWHPHKIARQVEVLARHGGDLGIVYCRYREIDEAGRVLRSPSFEPPRGDVYGALVLFNFLGGGSSALMRRDRLIAVGGFDPDVTRLGGPGAEDTMLFLRMAERWDCDLADAYLLGYRRMTGTMSTATEAMARSSDYVVADARARHPELPPRLFRWAAGEGRAYLGTEALYDGDWGAGLRLLRRAGAVDPGAVLRPRTAHALAIALRRSLAERLGRSARTKVPAQEAPGETPPGDGTDPTVGRLFLEVDPDLRPTRPGLPPALARRCAQAARWRTARPRAALGTAS